MSKKTLTTYNIAEYCHVTPRTAVQWINEGKLRAYRTPGNHSRVSVEDFVDFLKKYHMPVPEGLDIKEPDRRKRILIVDDDQDMVDSLQRFLIRQKVYDLQVAYDGFEAGQKFSVFKPDLLIVDYKMPGLNGYKLCANIRSGPFNNEVKIILISGVADEKEWAQIKGLGVEAYLQKPFSLQTLKEKMEELLREGSIHEEKR